MLSQREKVRYRGNPPVQNSKEKVDVENRGDRQNVDRIRELRKDNQCLGTNILQGALTVIYSGRLRHVHGFKNKDIG